MTTSDRRRSVWWNRLGPAALLCAALTACQDGAADDETGACDVLGESVVDQVTGGAAWSVQDDTLESTEDGSVARCDIEADDDSASLRIKASYPANEAVIAENVRQQLQDPDFQATLASPCTEYSGDPGTGIGCEIEREVSGRDEGYVYVHSEDTSISVVLAGWPDGSTPQNRLEHAETITRDFLDGFAAARAAED